MNDELLNGSVFKSLMLFAIPFMLSNLLQVLYGAADLWWGISLQQVMFQQFLSVVKQWRC